MLSIWLMILGWREVVCTFDAVQFGTTMQTLPLPQPHSEFQQSLPPPRYHVCRG